MNWLDISPCSIALKATEKLSFMSSIEYQTALGFVNNLKENGVLDTKKNGWRTLLIMRNLQAKSLKQKALTRIRFNRILKSPR